MANTLTAKQTKAKVIFSDEQEFVTDDIVRIGGEYYHRHRNGGARGQWDPKSFSASCQVVTRTEARRLALEWGCEPEEVEKSLA